MYGSNWSLFCQSFSSSWNGSVAPLTGHIVLLSLWWGSRTAQFWRWKGKLVLSDCHPGLFPIFPKPVPSHILISPYLFVLAQSCSCMVPVEEEKHLHLHCLPVSGWDLTDMVQQQFSPWLLVVQTAEVERRVYFFSLLEPGQVMTWEDNVEEDVELCSWMHARMIDNGQSLDLSSHFAAGESTTSHNFSQESLIILYFFCGR